MVSARREVRCGPAVLSRRALGCRAWVEISGVPARSPLVLSSAIAVVFPIVMRRKLATPELLRDRVMFSPGGEVVAWAVGLTCYAIISGLSFALLALRDPLLWGVVAISISLLVCVAWYVILYRRTIREMERELMSRDSSHPDTE